MKQQKRHRTNFISGVIALVTLGLLVLLAVALYKHTELEVRFDALISWLRRLDESIVGLDSDFEIILCIFALYVAKCQLPIPMGDLRRGVPVGAGYADQYGVFGILLRC